MSSKLDRSQIVAGAGLVASIFTALVKKVREQGGTDEDIHRLARPDGEEVLAEVARVIVGSACQTFKILVDYGKSLQEMIAAGNYDWVDGDITAEDFPTQGSGQQKIEVVLFHFNKRMTSEGAISEIKRAGCRPARIEELLALGASQPELQKQFPIVALGSSRRFPGGVHGVPYLDWFSAKRHLHLDWFGVGWGPECRFAAVPTIFPRNYPVS